MGRLVSFTKEQHAIARRDQDGRLLAISWRQNANSMTVTGPCTERQFRYIKRALKHIMDMEPSSTPAPPGRSDGRA